jgi:MFS family permease
VPPEDIVGAASLGSAQWNLGRVVGPALAALVILVGGFPTAFAINALSFFAVVIAFVFVKVPRAPADGAVTSLLNHMRAGVDTVRHNPPLRAAITMIALASATVAPFIALGPAVAARFTSGGPHDLAGPTGALTTAQGIGAVIAAVYFPTLVERFGRGRMLILVMVTTPLLILPYALAPSLALAVLGIFFVGASYICILSGLSAVMQLHAPPAFRARVLSLFFGTLSVVFPIGALVQGALANRVGLPTTMIGGAALMLIGLGFLALTRPELLEALDAPVPGHPHPAIVTDPADAQAVRDTAQRAS